MVGLTLVRVSALFETSANRKEQRGALFPDGRLGGVDIFGIFLDDAFDFSTSFCNFYGEYIVSDGNHCDSPLVFSTIL
jgi:hypothetical protein